MSEQTPIVEKIKKLLALANSSNEHEAALAAGHAQRLLSEHNLAMADIEAAHKPEPLTPWKPPQQRPYRNGSVT